MGVVALETVLLSSAGSTLLAEWIEPEAPRTCDSTLSVLSACIGRCGVLGKLRDPDAHNVSGGLKPGQGGHTGLRKGALD